MFVTPNISELQQRRKEKGFTQHQLSIKANLPGNALFRLEKQIAKRTSLLRANEIATALGCKVEDIFTPINKGA